MPEPAREHAAPASADEPAAEPVPRAATVVSEPQRTESVVIAPEDRTLQTAPESEAPRPTEIHVQTPVATEAPVPTQKAQPAVRYELPTDMVMIETSAASKVASAAPEATADDTPPPPRRRRPASAEAAAPEPLVQIETKR
jgi:hypothetical protein